MTVKKQKEPILAFLTKVAFGIGLYLIMVNVRHASNFFSYNDVVANVNDSLLHKIVYYVMNFSEGEFYGGFFTSIFLVIGAVIAWQLYQKNSKWQGFAISGGSGVWPWVFLSQVISLFLTIFVFDFTRFFSDEVMWLPTFIVVVGTPPALTLIYGPGWKKLITISTLSAIFTFPFANWMNNYIMPTINVPGAVSNVATMAVIGLIISAICYRLPWMTPSQAPIAIERNKMPQKEEDTFSFKWSIRRTLADFSEAWFYGNEIVGLFVLTGVLIDWFVNIDHITNGSGMVPEIVLGQIIASATGVLLYRKQFETDGWAPTFMPLVSTVPSVILMFSSGFLHTVLLGLLAGILSAPVGSYIARNLPDYVPKAVGFVSGMTVVTIIIGAVFQLF